MIVVGVLLLTGRQLTLLLPKPARGAPSTRIVSMAGYGCYELQLFHGDGDPSDPIVDAAGEIQSTLVGWLDTIGPVPLLNTLTVLVGAASYSPCRTRAK